MALSLRLTWHPPVDIREGLPHEKLLWVCDDPESLPAKPGAYVYARTFGRNIEPMYVGQAENIQKRSLSHLKGNVPLMKAIGAAKNGGRVILACELNTRRGQQLGKALDILEDTLIRQALLAGYKLINKKGTVWPTHQLQFEGARAGLRLFGQTLAAEAKR